MSRIYLDVAGPTLKHPKSWLFCITKWPHRRLSSQLLCRLPLLILWTFVMTVVLYKFLVSNEGDNEDDNAFTSKEVPSLESIENHEELSSYKNQLLQQKAGPIYQVLSTNKGPTIMTYPVNKNHESVTSTKKPEVYSRQSKVFILIVQHENLPHTLGQPFKRSSSQVNAHSIKNDRPGETGSKIKISAHIRLVIDILESHRIEYTIDTTRNGLPSSLLNDRGDINNESKQQYSVIIIDDFVMYTRLNRWIRDQLDRHCRLNKIGVITYLNSGAPNLMDEISASLSTQKPYSTPQASAFHPFIQNSMNAVPGEELVAEQFPLVFKPIDQRECKQNLSSACPLDFQVNDRSPILRILKRKPNFIIRGPLMPNLNQVPWISMSSNHITYEPLTWVRLGKPNSKSHTIDSRAISKEEFSPSENLGLFETEDYATSPEPFMGDDVRVLSTFDRGLYDGIKRVIFGGANHFWLNRILLLDSIEHLSLGRVLSPLDRFVQIDIDDIFVAERGKRMNESDVDALIAAQTDLRRVIDGGFKFNLGFSGKYYKHGYETENAGDEKLVKKAQEFTWFCHTWSHSKAHLANDTSSIVLELRKNLEFARQNKLPMIGYSSLAQMDAVDGGKPPTYAVAPHHSGVYPIHEQLYEAWQSELNVQVTSTEEYPRLRPASGRRAFVHKSIKVLPRQTCGLYTHTVYRNKYPGGIAKLDADIRGGELFETILHNPVNIYMTHMTNYANDRLAPYTFSALFDFVREHTNLQLRYAPSATFDANLESPLRAGGSRALQLKSRAGAEDTNVDEQKLGPAALAKYYFGLYPDETKPLWTNPCRDKRHLAIWAQSKHRYCHIVPKLLIVGPQKTGTTALYTYLKLNPLFKSSRMSPVDFEEVQFFNDKNYLNGADWYFDRFAAGTSSNWTSSQSTIVSEDRDNESDFMNSSSSNNNNEMLDISLNVDYEQQDEFYYFDKSATYFDDPAVAQRASHLLPEVRILIMLIDPADRAYSWYQHVKAHGDPVAVSHTFDQIIMAPEVVQSTTLTGETSSATSSVNALRKRCIQPGFYSQHLARWLSYYPSRQIIIVDGQWFRYQPASVMNKLQLILRVTSPLDYNKLLVYNRRKGFHCSRASPNQPVKCLGPGKGRKYGPMSARARSYLNRLYFPHNKQLVRLLSDIGQPLPLWLEEATKARPTSGTSK